MKTYKGFVQQCLDNNNLEGICSLKEYNQMTKQLKEDGVL